MAAEAAGECKKQSVGLGIDSGVEGELEFGEGTTVNIGTNLGFGVSVKAIDDLPRRVDGGPDNVVPFF